MPKCECICAHGIENLQPLQYLDNLYNAISKVESLGE